MIDTHQIRSLERFPSGLWLWFLPVSLLVFGCQTRYPNEKRCIPVTGEVYVDGQPAAGVLVACHPAGGIDVNQPTVTQGITNAQGRFELTTYEAGDGAPLGEYRLTFTWQDFKVLSASFSGPDKLKGRYDDAEKSDIRLTVVEGKPMDLGRIELATQ